MKFVKFLFFLLAFTSMMFAREHCTIKSQNFIAEFKESNVVFLDTSGNELFALGRVHLYYTGSFGEISKVEKLDASTLRLIYSVKGQADVKFDITLKLAENEIYLSYKISAPEEIKKRLQGLTQYILEPKRSNLKIQNSVYKHGLWTRVEGGTPYEKCGSYSKMFSVGDIVFASAITGNHYYCGGNRCTVGLKSEGENLVGSMTIRRFVGYRDFEVAAALDKQKFALRLSTEKPFNIFENSDAKFDLEASSVSEIKETVCSVKAFDFDGKLVVDWSEKWNFQQQGRIKKTFKLPEDRRNIFFVEATVKDASSQEENFTCSNVVSLPPHKFKHIKSSRIGISGNFKIWEHPEIAKLWNRLGIRLNRSGDNTKTEPLGVVSFMTAGANPDIPFNPEKHNADVKAIVDKLAKSNAPWLEFGNEWSTSGPARRDMKIKYSRAQNYVKWLKAIRAEMKERRLDNVKVMSVATGGAGGDTKFYQMLYDLGAWDLMDAMCFHPGRGSCTADKTGGGWTYLGGVQNMKRKIQELGEKPLFLTEVYAVCQPNNAWCDSYRQAADNLLLSVVLGYVEDIAGIFLFKFNDGITWDINGVNEKDREWHYGIMLRDFSPKPSMMACATASEHLDGAKFIRMIQPENTTLKIYEFDSPRGKFCVMFERKDGYQHYKKRPTPFVHKQPWIDTWKSKVEHTFESSSSSVFVYDVIGRGKKYQAKFGKVKLILDGSPRIVYGLKL